MEISTPIRKRDEAPHRVKYGEKGGIVSRRPNIWSGKRDLNPRPSPWQGDALPLSYSRSLPTGQRGAILLMQEQSCQANKLFVKPCYIRYIDPIMLPNSNM